MAAPLRELERSGVRIKIERADVRRFGGEAQPLLALAQFAFAFMRQPFLLLLPGHIGAENNDAVFSRINSSIQPASPGGVEKLALGGHAFLHHLLGELVEFAADGLGKNFPDDASDHFFLRPTGEIGHLVVDVDVTPVAIQGRERVANAGQDRLAFGEEITHLVLPPARPQSDLHRADEDHAAEGTLQESHIPARAEKFQDLDAGRVILAGRARQDEHRQVRPRRLGSQGFEQFREFRSGERFFGQQDSGRAFADLPAEVEQARANLARDL